MIDVQFASIRLGEVLVFTLNRNVSSVIEYLQSSAANFFADIVRHAYDDVSCMRGGSDGALISTGTFRGDSTYGPGMYFCHLSYCFPIN